MKYSSFLLVLFSLLLSACGGGNGSSGDNGGLRYTGETRGVDLTIDTAQTLFADIFAPTSSIGSVVGVETNSSIGGAPLLSQLNKFAEFANETNFLNLAGVRVDETESCSAGGSLRIEGDLNEATNAIDANLRFTSCNEEGLVFDGVMSIEGVLNQIAEFVGPVDIRFANLRVSSGSESAVLDGSMECRYGEYPNRLTGSGFVEESPTDQDLYWCLQNLLVQDPASNKVYRYEDFEVISGLIGVFSSTTDFQAYVRATDLLGRYYEPDLGYVDVSSGPTEIEAASPLGGVLFLAEDPSVFFGQRFLGLSLTLNGSASSAQFEYLDSTSYSLSIDYNGDGVYSDTVVLPWVE